MSQGFRVFLLALGSIAGWALVLFALKMLNGELTTNQLIITGVVTIVFDIYSAALMKKE